jgi:multiple sugar transport system substrate-binding protein
MIMRPLRLVAAGMIVSLAVAGCANQSDKPKDPNLVTVWTTEDQAERVETQQRILDGWASKTGSKVRLVAVGEDQLVTVLTASAAANDLPDVIGALSLNGMSQLLTDELLDPDAATQIVADLGVETFSKRALELTSSGGRQVAVPSDGFAQLLFYRKDLFASAGLPEPKTYADIQQAASKLNQGSTAGIVAGTAPGDSFTQQTFEQVGLANNCQLVNEQGDITLTSPQCQESFDFYANLIKTASVPGNQDADTTRATYFAGDAAMTIWSSFLLDEMAGLRDDALPTCDQCKDDPTWLAKNTGILTTMQGPSGTTPVGFGEIVSWNVLRGASPKAQDLVKYMMSDGYLDWLGIAPEGKVPTRQGTASDPDAYTEAWMKLEAGVDRKALLTDVYAPEVLDAIADSPNSFQRWGFDQGQGQLAAVVAGQFIVPQALAMMINSDTSAADATEEAQVAAETVKTDLGV